MNKGYRAAVILAQCQRLDAADIRYSFLYLAGIAGAGRGQKSAETTAAVCNALRPTLVWPNKPDSRLAAEAEKGMWRKAGEMEKYKEIRTLLAVLSVYTVFAAMGAAVRLAS